MMRYRLLLRCVAASVADHGMKCLLGTVPFAEKLYDIAKDAYDRYKKGAESAERLAQVEEAAQASLEEIRQEVAEVLKEIQTKASPEKCQQLHDPAVELALVSYLHQVPGSIRSSMRRPADPSGRSVPAGFKLQSAEDFLRLLPAGPPRFKPGDQPLAADWELVELLGKGGFGEVWKARHQTMPRQQPVALKFCLDPVAAHSLRNEAHLHAVLSQVREQGTHPGIVPLRQTYLRADPPCLEYEYVEGGELTGLIEEMHQNRKLTPQIAARIMLGLASIVAFAHRLDPPVVHRDLKLNNILVRQGKGDLPELFITDFGIGGLAAKQVLHELENRRNASNKMLPTAIRGAYTPLYASPQQIQGDSPDPRDDVHALGIIWYQLVTGDLTLMTIPPDWRDLVEERGLSGEQIKLLASCIGSRAERWPANAVVLVDWFLKQPEIPHNSRAGNAMGWIKRLFASKPSPAAMGGQNLAAGFPKEAASPTPPSSTAPQAKRPDGSLNINCPHCSAYLSVPAQYSGELMKCPKCSDNFTVPDWDPTSSLPRNSPPPNPPPSSTVPQGKGPGEALKINCPHCSAYLSVPAQYSGMLMKCPRCSDNFKVP